jgi:hypothetical protein
MPDNPWTPPDYARPHDSGNGWSAPDYARPYEEPKEESNWFGDTWDFLTTPLSGGAIRRNVADPFAEFMYGMGDRYPSVATPAYYGGAFAQGVGGVLDQSTSPLELGLMATTGGASHFASGARAAQKAGNLVKAGELAATARALDMPGRIASTGMVGHGAYRAATGDTTEEQLSGGLEAILGGLGMRSIAKGPNITVLDRLPIPEPRQLKTRIPEEPINVPGPTRFIGGEAGVADVNTPYKMDIDSPLPGDMMSGSGTILPNEYGGLISLAPDLAARRGINFGTPRTDMPFDPRPALTAGSRFTAGDSGVRDNQSVLDFGDVQPNLPQVNNEVTPNLPAPVTPHPMSGMTPEQIREKIGIDKIVQQKNNVPVPESSFELLETDAPHIQAMKQRANTLYGELRQTGTLAPIYRAELQDLMNQISMNEVNSAPKISEMRDPKIPFTPDKLFQGSEGRGLSKKKSFEEQWEESIKEAKLVGLDPTKYDNLDQLQWDITRKTAIETMNTGRNPLTQGDKPSEMRVPGTNNIAVGGADPEVLDMLATALYAKQDNPATVAKEGLQNSVDELNISGNQDPIKIVFDSYSPHPVTKAIGRSLIVKDNGRGMNFDQLSTIYTDVGKSGKRDNPNAAGGFGFAKLAPLLSGDYVKVESVTKVGDDIIKYTFEGNPKQLKDQSKGVPVNEEIMPPGTQTGFKVETFFPQTKDLYNAENLIKSIVTNSPGMDNVQILDPGYSNNKTKVNEFLNSSDVQGGEQLKGLVQSPLVHTLKLPEADLDIHYNKDNVERSRVKIAYLNNGIFVKAEDRNLTWSGPIPDVPEKIVVNIKSNLEEGVEGYPFGLNREEINHSIIDQLNQWMNDTFVKPGQLKQKNELQTVYDSLQPTPGNSYVILDSGGKYTERELKHLENSPSMKAIGEVMGGMLSQLGHELQDLATFQTEKFGIRSAEVERGGINIPSQKGDKKTTILINPFSAITLAKNPRQAADRMVHIVMHEFAHNIARSEDGDYTWALSRVYERHDLEEQLYDRERILKGITGKDGNYTPEIQRLLQEYSDSRGRPATTEDVLSRASESADTQALRPSNVYKRNKPDGSGTSRKPTVNDGGPTSQSDRVDRAVLRQNQMSQKASIDKLGLILKTTVEGSIPLREEQEAIYSKIRGEKAKKLGRVRSTGEAGFDKQRNIMRGAMPKVEGMPAIRPLLEQADVDNLFDSITNTDMDEFQKLRTKFALLKLLDGTKVPQRNEIKLLGQAFGPEFETGIQHNIELQGGLGLAGATPEKISNFVSQSANFFKSVMASIDLSIPLRNALPAITQKAWWTSLDDMVKAWGSEKFYDATIKAMEDDPYYSLLELAGVDFLDMGKNLLKRDEAYHSKWAESLKIPGAPKTNLDPLQLASSGIKASNRAAVIFGNKLRFDLAKSLIKTKMKIMDPTAISSENVADTVKDAKTIAKFVNAASGRGHLGKAEKYAQELNAVFFSPKMQASRIFFLNPWNYIDPKNAMMRKEMLKAALGIGMAWTTINAALEHGFGAEVQYTDQTTADWGKAKFGDTRVEPSGGFQKFIVAMSRIREGKSTSSVSGNVSKFNERYNSPDRGTILGSLMENAMSPMASLMWGMFTGKDFLGRPFNVRNEMMRRVTPIISQDLYDLHKSDPDLVPLAVLSAIGMGVNTYEPNTQQGRPQRPQRPSRFQNR